VRLTGIASAYGTFSIDAAGTWTYSPTTTTPTSRRGIGDTLHDW